MANLVGREALRAIAVIIGCGKLRMRFYTQRTVGRGICKVELLDNDYIIPLLTFMKIKPYLELDWICKRGNFTHSVLYNVKDAKEAVRIIAAELIASELQN